MNAGKCAIAMSLTVACASGGSQTAAAHLESIPRYDSAHQPDCPYAVLAEMEVDDGWFGDDPEMADAAKRRQRDQDRLLASILADVEADALLRDEVVGTLAPTTRVLFIRWTEPGCLH